MPFIIFVKISEVFSKTRGDLYKIDLSKQAVNNKLQETQETNNHFSFLMRIFKFTSSSA